MKTILSQILFRFPKLTKTQSNPVILNGLVALSKSMKDQDIDRYRFEYRHGKALFDVFFFIDEKPYVLLFGAKGENFSFEVIVSCKFEIEIYLDNTTYYGLCRVLQLRYNPDNRFSTRGFFEEFNQATPSKAKVTSIPEPHEIANYRSVAEEEDKTFFLSWRNNAKRGDQVSETNLMKTKQLLSYKAFERCKDKNISSCWTDDSTKAKKYKLPE